VENFNEDLFMEDTQYTFGNILFWTYGQIIRVSQTVLLSYGYEWYCDISGCIFYEFTYWL